jgi:dihydroorotate dehydrogenase (fumarate)
MDFSTTYLGLSLKTPIIAGSSGLTSSVKKVKELEAAGAGAVVLKSLFEEEIAYEYADFMKQSQKEGEAYRYFDYDGRKNPVEYYDYVIREKNLEKYMALIKDSKNEVSIPVMASINCYYHSLEWISFARHLEEVGADALELNMFFPPTDFEHTREEKEEIYFKTIEKIKKAISIPIALKISHYFTDLGPMIEKLSKTGIQGLVLFNRFFSPDFDIDTFEVKPSFVFSTPSELAMSLRWIAIMSGKVDCDLAASTGIHDGAAIIKQILAGAHAVQAVSCLYKNGPGYINKLLDAVEEWMTRKRFESLSDFRGRMSQDQTKDPAIYDRVQFMRYFGGKKNVTL